MSKIYLAEKSQLDSIGPGFCACSTAAATAAKTASLSNFILKTGAQVSVKFSYTNTASSPTLNINNTGAKSIYYHNSAVPASMLMSGGVYLFVYDGSRWQLLGNHFAPASESGTLESSLGSNLFFNDVKNSSKSGASMTFGSNPQNTIVLSSSGLTTTAYCGKIDFAKYLAQGYKGLFFDYYIMVNRLMGGENVKIVISSSKSSSSGAVTFSKYRETAGTGGTNIMDLRNLNGSYYFIVEINAGLADAGAVTFTISNMHLLT